MHGIADVKRGSTTAVAIGDTFIFSPSFSKISTAPPASPSCADLCLFPHVHDSFCLTHAVAPYRAMLGPGAESSSAKRLVAATKSVHM